VGFASYVNEHVVLREFAGIVALPRQQLVKAAHEFLYVGASLIYVQIACTLCLQPSTFTCFLNGSMHIQCTLFDENRQQVF
jgi:hypothetical protein